MALRQSRRTVSLNRKVFEDAKVRACVAGMSLSKFVEEAIANRLALPATTIENANRMIAAVYRGEGERIVSRKHPNLSTLRIEKRGGANGSALTSTRSNGNGG